MSVNETEFLKSSTENSVALLSIDRPPLNVLGFSHFDRLCRTLLELVQSKEVKVVIVTGNADAFGSGFDIREIASMSNPDRVRDETMRIKLLLMKLEAATKPIIAAIRGNCFGGGLELAMTCHLRIATAEAKIGLPEINIATIPTLGGTVRLPRIVGRPRALELLLTGKLISGEEAFRIGLINEVCSAEELIPRAKALGRTISEKGGLAIAAAIQVVTESMGLDIEQAMRLESEVSGSLIGTNDLKEGVAAFLERRKAIFTNS